MFSKLISVPPLPEPLPGLLRRSSQDRPLFVQPADFIPRIAQFLQDFLGVLAELRSRAEPPRCLAQLDGQARDAQPGEPRVVDLCDIAVGQHLLVFGQVLVCVDRTARYLARLKQPQPVSTIAPAEPLVQYGDQLSGVLITGLRFGEPWVSRQLRDTGYLAKRRPLPRVDDRNGEPAVAGPVRGEQRAALRAFRGCHRHLTGHQEVSNVPSLE